MKAKAVGYFRCPKCVGSLVFPDRGFTAGEETQEGDLSCQSCGTRYPIVDDIPRFAGSENYARSFGLQWSRHSRSQIDKFTGLSISRERFFGVTGWPKNLEGELILEAGSGAGRFTQIACETGAEVFSFDYSRAVEINRENNKECANLHIFQADIFEIPLEKGLFDKVFCFGVLQHTPDPERAFRCLAGFVKPGGHLAIDIYRKSFSALLSWKYLLRPLTRRIPKERLYTIIAAVVPPLLPAASWLRKVGGRLGGRLLPIVEYSHLLPSKELNLDWAILDTFDMYSCEYDLPQSSHTVVRWFREAGLVDVSVGLGPNGVVGRGRKPLAQEGA